MRETITTIVARCDLADCRAEFDPSLEPITMTLTGGGFGKKGRTITLDLCDTHRDEYERVLGRWMSAHTSGRKAEAARVGAIDDSLRSVIRAWAVAAGEMKPGARGKIPAAVVEKYHEAHRTPAARRDRGVA